MELCKYANFPYLHYRDTIPPLQINNKFNLYWDVQIETFNKLLHNRPDIVLINLVNHCVIIVEVAVLWALGGGGLVQMEKRKYAKYGINSNLNEKHSLPYPKGINLKNELYDVLPDYKIDIVPIVIGCCREVSTNLQKLKDTLPFDKKKTNTIIKRLERAAVESSNRILFTFHYYKNSEKEMCVYISHTHLPALLRTSTISRFLLSLL